MNYIKQILQRLFENLETHDISYCVLHGYEKLPESVPSDVDIAIDPAKEKNLDILIYNLAAETDSFVTQKIYYDVPRCYYYVICHASDNKIDIVQLDFLIDHVGINRYFFTSEELIKDRRKFKMFYIPKTSTETIYLLLKKVMKGQFLKDHQMRLQHLYFANPSDNEKNFNYYFGKHNLKLIKNLILKYEGTRKEDLLQLRQSFKKRNINISKKIQGIAWQIKRVLYRIINPTGMFVVILSPDGGGKTSVANGVLQTLRQSFRRTLYLYWRPTILPEIGDLIRFRLRKKRKKQNPEPHKNKNRGYLSSYLRFFYYSLDFLIGYIKIRILKTITTLIVMDRYYYDFLVDRKRYGFNLPDKLPAIISRIIPKPDLIIYLDNNPEAIYKRKNELTLTELERQVNKFRNIIKDMPNAYTVDTNKRLDDVIHETAALIIKVKADNLKRQLGIV